MTGRHAIGHCRANHADARCLLGRLVLGPPASGLVFISFVVFFRMVFDVPLHAIQIQFLAFAERTPGLVLLFSLPNPLAPE